MNQNPNVNILQITGVFELKILKPAYLILDYLFLEAVFIHFHLPACRYCLSFAREI